MRKLLAILLALAMALSLSSVAWADDEYIAQIGETKYATMQEAFEACPKNATSPTEIILLRDVPEGSGFGFPDTWTNSGRNILLNMGNHTYTFKEPAVGSSNTESQAMHLINGNTLTIKNGTLAIHPGSTVILRMIQNYCDLTLENVIVDTSSVPEGFSNYNNSFCRGTVTLKGNTQFKASSDTAVIFDIDGSYCDKHGCDVGLVIDNSFTGSIGGKVEYVASTKHDAILSDNADYFAVRCGNYYYGSAEAASKGDVVAMIGPVGYTSLADAVEGAAKGDTIILLKSITISDAAKGNTAGIIEISKKVTISGDGHTTITVAQPNGDAQKASAFNILSGGDVKFQNVVIDGNKTAKHGINVFGGKVELDTVTLQNFTGYGIVVQGTAAATNLTTKNNGWGGVNVDVNSYTNNSEFTMISGNVESVVVEHSNTNTTYTSRAAISGGTVGIAIIKQGDKAVTKLNGAALSITGGTFYEDVSDYVADGVAVARVYYSTEGKTVYIVGGDAIAEAINTATNEEITVINGGTINGIKGGKIVWIEGALVTSIRNGESTLVINGITYVPTGSIGGDYYRYIVPTPTNPEPDPKPEPKPDPKPERPVRRYPTNNTTTTTDTKTDSVTSARTFDAGVALYVGMSALSLTSSAALLGKKKEF